MRALSEIRENSLVLAPQAESALQERLFRLRNDPPEYGNGLSDHLPMVLTVLAGAGAPADRLDAFTARYRPKTQALPATGDAALRYERYPELRERFRQSLERDGKAAVLREQLPFLLGCVEAAAFHCVIRLSHALRSGLLDEIANALAFWVICLEPLPPANQVSDLSFENADAWIEALHQGASQEARARRPGLITDRLRDVAQFDTYRQLAQSGAKLPCDLADAVQSVGRSAGRIYSLTGNFTVLHVVTGSEALLHVLTFVDPNDAASQRPALFSSYAAVFLAAEPIMADEFKAPQMTWPEVRSLAIQSDDEHVVKLVFSAANWNRRFPNAFWLVGATRAVVGR